MKKVTLLFFALLILGLLPFELKAQGAVDHSTFLKESKEPAHRQNRQRLQDISTLSINRSGRGNDLIPIAGTFHTKDTAYLSFLKGSTYNESKQIKKKSHRAADSGAKIYFIDKSVVFSAATTDTNRFSYSYDASGHILTNLHEKWQNGQWMNSERHTCAYDASGNILTNLYEKWQNNQWTTSFRNTYAYDTRVNILTNLYEKWQNNQWTNSGRETKAYDPNGNLLTDLVEDWQNGQWTNSQRVMYTYDASGNMLTDLDEKWQNGQWTNAWRYTDTYDVRGHILTNLYEEWQNGKWTNSGRSTDTYDTSGNRLTVLYEAWLNGQLTTSFRNTYAYDTRGNILTNLYETWQNNQWTNSGRETKAYDANGNMLTDLIEEWQNNQWTNSGRETKAYDANGNMLTDLVEDWLNGQWTNSWRKTYAYDAYNNLVLFTMMDFYQNSVWLPCDEVWSVTNGSNYFYYSGYEVRISYKLTDVTGISANKPDIPTNFSLGQNYPNPFNPSTSISFSIPTKSFVKLKIYDLLGREIATIANEELSAGTYTRQWNAAGLSSGVYFYRLQAGNFTETKKLNLLK